MKGAPVRFVRVACRAPIFVVPALLGLVAGCARQGSPSGGIQDRVPPVVVRVEPDTFAVVEPGVDRLRVWFNERISEQTQGGTLESAVQVSPEIPGLEVSHRRDGLDINLPDGLQPGVAYAVRIRPVVRDLFGNSMVAPFEWIVSTGGEPSPNAVVGQVWDRVTGEYLPDIRVVLGEGGVDVLGDSTSGPVRYVSVSGDEGIYALRFLPPGPLSVLAFQDRNRNRLLDPGEPRGVAGASVNEADTVFLSIPVLVPDTTPAVVVRAEAVDSTVIRLLFDDALEPQVGVDRVLVSLRPDTVPPQDSTVTPVGPDELPGITDLFQERRWAVVRDSLVAAADTAFQTRIDSLLALGDSASADSVRTAGRSPVPGGQDRGPQTTGGAAGVGQRGMPLPDGSPRPARSLVLLLDSSLPSGMPVLFDVQDVVNVNGLGGGGGTVSLTWTRPEVQTDSVEVPEPGELDSPPDTAGVGPVLRPGSPSPNPDRPLLRPGNPSRSPDRPR